MEKIFTLYLYREKRKTKSLNFNDYESAKKAQKRLEKNQNVSFTDILIWDI